MDLVAADIESLSASADANAFTFPPPASSSSSISDIDDIDNPNSSIASLMQISEKMDSLLPFELSNAHVPIYDPAIQISFPTLNETENFHLPPTPAPSPLPACLPGHVSVHHSVPSSVDPHSHYNVHPQNLHQNLLKNINYLVQMKHIHSPTLTATSTTSPPPPPHAQPCHTTKTGPITRNEHASLKLSKVPVNTVAQSGTTMQSHPTTHTQYPTTPALSPCSIRDVSPTFTSDPSTSTPERRARTKTSRKPKTYTKPVASRFCHICSRTPRRGHSAAVCSRMAQGLCRKIVCEQCFREQGWDFEATQQNPSSWRCPHCTDTCPARSQCHIYNRINARRKRNGTTNNDGSGQLTKRVKTPNKGSPLTRKVGMVGKPTKQQVKVERVLTMEHGAMWA